MAMISMRRALFCKLCGHVFFEGQFLTHQRAKGRGAGRPRCPNMDHANRHWWEWRMVAMVVDLVDDQYVSHYTSPEGVMYWKDTPTQL